VARKGKLVYADAVGVQDKEEGKPMALDSLFRIYSMTKPLVSVGAMMLVEEGRIQLTDPVSKSCVREVLQNDLVASGVSLFDRRGRFFVPTCVQGGAARSGLDGGEHGARLGQVGT
jgi:hypothetical protein